MKEKEKNLIEKWDEYGLLDSSKMSSIQKLLYYNKFEIGSRYIYYNDLSERLSNLILPLIFRAVNTKKNISDLELMSLLLDFTKYYEKGSLYKGNLYKEYVLDLQKEESDFIELKSEFLASYISNYFNKLK